MSHDEAQTPRPEPANFDRRTFIKGVIAGGVGASSGAYLFRNSPLLRGQAAPTGNVERLLTLVVNGQTRRVDVAPQETLATTLRYKLGLTGTKLGCDRAECGACTVLVDDVPRYSCSVLTHAVRSREIQTIEGKPLTQYPFRALGDYLKVKESPKYFWADKTGAVSRYSQAYVDKLKQIDGPTFNAAIKAYKNRSKLS